MYRGRAGCAHVSKACESGGGRGGWLLSVFAYRLTRTTVLAGSCLPRANLYRFDLEACQVGWEVLCVECVQRLLERPHSTCALARSRLLIAADEGAHATLAGRVHATLLHPCPIMFLVSLSPPPDPPFPHSPRHPRTTRQFGTQRTSSCSCGAASRMTGTLCWWVEVGCGWVGIPPFDVHPSGGLGKALPENGGHR
jgi:hypothetical protein